MITATLTVTERTVTESLTQVQLTLRESDTPPVSIGVLLLSTSAWRDYIRPRFAYTYNFCRTEFLSDGEAAPHATPHHSA